MIKVKFTAIFTMIKVKFTAIITVIKVKFMVIITMLKVKFMVIIDPFPIIGFYLYHVISADQSNNWTTSGIWSCNNLLLLLHAFHLYS